MENEFTCKAAALAVIIPEIDKGKVRNLAAEIQARTLVMLLLYATKIQLKNKTGATKLEQL